MKRHIYFDNSATTPLDQDILQQMMPYFTTHFANANSLHSYGRECAHAVDTARARVARSIGADKNEIYFTSGGTEADNWAISFMRQHLDKQLIVSAIEHAGVREPAHDFKKVGGCLFEIPVDESGLINLDALEQALKARDTALVSVMMANNEIGTIQPIKEVVQIAKRYGAKVHTDAVQAVGSIDFNVHELGVDMLSLSAHKFYGPKGIGALYVRNGFRPLRLIHGGHQERTMRGGTSNVPLIVGLGYAIEKAVEGREANNIKIKALRDRFVSRVESEIKYVKLNGHRQNRLVQNANFSFEFLEGESILIRLDMAGIATSSGSACSSGSLDPSHVLLATGLPIELAHGSIRFSFGKYNTQDEVDYAVDKLKQIVDSLRAISPLYPY